MPLSTLAADACDVLPDDADLELLADFVAEGRDYVACSEAALLALECDPDDAEAVNAVFRAFHTVKGTAGFLGLERLAEFAHHAETLLARVREGEIPYTRVCADVALRATDMLGQLLGRVQDAAPGAAVEAPDGYDTLHAELVRVAEASLDEMVAMAAVDEARPRDVGLGERVDVVDGSVRVRADRLDQLVELAERLVGVHGAIAAEPLDTNASGTLREHLAHAAMLARALHDVGRSLRTVPLRGTFQKVARLVRELAHRSGKIVDFQAEGEDVEVARLVADAIGDPLVHLVRNAIDHGLEHVPDRVVAGKSPVGTIRLRAVRTDDAVVVALTDDGRGLDRERIVARAVERGLVPPGACPSEGEAHALIFAPGFSTAAEVTALSGRGVGMDVVRRAVEAAGGAIEIATRPGQGTTFALRFPRGA